MEKQILKALKKVSDPEIQINIVDMGLIYSLKESDGRVEISMTFTSPMCPYGAELKRNVRKAVLKVKGVLQVTVKLTFTPLWKPEKISKEARLALGL